jgi:hypothetical protein
MKKKVCCRFSKKGWGSEKGAIYVYHTDGAELGTILCSREQGAVVFDAEWGEVTIQELSEILEYMKKNKNKIVKSSK